MSPAEERRLRLVRWMREQPGHPWVDTKGIVEATRIYDEFRSGRQERCFDDLKVLAKRGVVERGKGRPAQWRVAA